MKSTARRVGDSVSPLRARPRAISLAAGAAMSLAAFCAPVQAQWQWSNSFNGTTVNWNSATSWSAAPAGPPVSGTDTTLSFGYNFGSTAQVASNNFAAGFNLNGITVNNDSAGGLTISGASVNWNQSSGGVNPSITNTGNIASTMSLPGVLLAPLTIGGAGSANLTLSGAYSGNFGMNFSTTGFGVVSMSVANSFAGAVTVNSGNVSIGNATSFGPAANVVTINGGTLRTSAAVTDGHNFTLNSNLFLMGTSNAGFAGPIFTGAMSGSGGITYRPSTSYTANVTYQGNNTFGGAYFAQPFGNAVASATLSGANGAFSNVSSMTLTANQSIVLDNSATNNNNRLNDSAPIAMNRASIQVQGNASAATTENLGAITFTGGDTLLANNNLVAQNTTVNASSISRSGRGTLIVQGANLGTAGGPTTANIKDSSGLTGAALVGGGGVAGSTNISILPYASGINFTSTTAGAGQLVTYDATNGFRPLAASEYASVYQSQGSFTGNNLRATTNTVIGGTTLANAVALDSVSAATTGSGLYMKPGSVLTCTSGAFLSSISNPTSTALTASTLPSIVAGGTLNFGAAEGIAHIQNNTAILTDVSGSSGFTKAGNGSLILSGAKSFSGPVTVNAGVVDIDSDSELGNAGNSITLAGGNVSGIVFAPSMLVGTSTLQSLTIARNVTLGPAGGGFQPALTNNQLTVSGVISGSGPLYTGVSNLGNSGVLKLTGANTYSGPTIIFSNVAVNSDSNLGTGTDIVMAGGYLRNDGPFTTSKNMTLTGSTRLFTNGADATINGTINAHIGALAIVKTGTNNLTLTANNPFNGSLQIGDTATLGTMDHFVTGGTMALSGANGALPSATAAAVLSSSTLTLDNVGANNTNRLSGNVSLGGGTLNFLGNSGAASTETIGTLAFTGFSPAAGNGTAIVNIAPGSGQSAVLTVSDVARAGSGTMLLRGPNFGGAIGANTANLVANTASSGVLAATNFTNGCVGGVVMDNSLSGNGTDLANYLPGTGFIAASYGPANTFGAAVNSDLTSMNVLGGATSANAIRLSAGGGIDTNGAVLTLGVPAMILANGGASNTINATGGGSIAFPASSVGTIWNNSDLTVNAPLTGLTSLNKSGVGTLTLNAPSAGTSTIVSNGTLKLGIATALPATSALVVGTAGSNVGTLDLNGFAVTANSLAGIGNVINNNSLTLATPGSTQFGGAMSGTGSLTISGSMTINGVSSYTGDTTVRNAGTLTIGANQPAGGPGPLGSGGNLILGDATTNGTLAFTTNVSFFNKNIVVPASTATVAGISPIAGNNVSIGGTVTLSRDFRLGGGSIFSSALPYSGGLVTFTNTVQDGTAPGIFDWFGGNVNLWGNNTFSGGVLAFPGSADPETCFLGIGSNTALGTGQFKATSTASGNLRADNGARSLANDFQFQTSSASRMGFAGVNDLTVSGRFDLGGGDLAGSGSIAGPRSLNVINAGITTLSGVISGTSASTLNKTGDGKLVMSNVNTFAGNVTVSAGVLLVNGNNTGAGSYTVNAGAILGGFGSIAGSVSVAAGGIIEPGASAGTLTTGNLGLVSGSVLTYELAAQGTVGSGVNDLINVIGTATIPTSGIVVVNVLGLPGFLSSVGPNTYTLITTSGGLVGGNAVNFVLGFYPPTVTSYSFDTTSQPGNVLLTVIPTPGSGVLLGLAGLFAGRRRRRS